VESRRGGEQERWRAAEVESRRGEKTLRFEDGLLKGSGRREVAHSDTREDEARQGESAIGMQGCAYPWSVEWVHTKMRGEGDFEDRESKFALSLQTVVYCLRGASEQTRTMVRAMKTAKLEFF
jgi:hypothetical protein